MRAAVGLALSVAIGFRLWGLDNIPGLNGDEAWYGVQAMRLLHGEAISWRTPTGNPLNVFFFAPLVGLHAVLEPSVALLRSVSAASGLLLFVVNYWLCRRAFDARTATISTLLLAVLPINIAYSRFAWDASQSALAVTLVLYFSLIGANDSRRAKRCFTLAAVALCGACWVHPTNVFAAPLLLIPLANRQLGIAPRAFARAKKSARAARRMAIILGVGSGIALFSIVAMRQGSLFVSALARLVDVGQMGQFLDNYAGLFSGTTIYRFIPGSLAAAPRSVALWQGSFFALSLLAMWGLLGRLQDPSNAARRLDELLLASWGAMLAGFYLVAGPDALAPHFERYGMSLIAPGVALFSRGVAGCLQGSARQRRLTCLLGGATCAALLAGFYLNYFVYFVQTGGSSHVAFRTAGTEPKRQALAYILAQRAPDHTAWIVAGDWWTYWPLAYLAAREADAHVVALDDLPPELCTRSGLLSGDVWFVDFQDSPQKLQIERILREHRAIATQRQITDYAGRPLLNVIAPAEENFRKY